MKGDLPGRLFYFQSSAVLPADATSILASLVFPDMPYSMLK